MASFSVNRKQGIDWVFNISAQSNGVAQDITGYTIKLELQKVETGAVALDLAIGTGITVSAPTTGVALFRVTGAQTAALAVGTYRVYVKAIAPGIGGQADEWADGYLIIEKGVVA